jgi:ATP-dependent Clp protease ATP-binding subunit ClpB
MNNETKDNKKFIEKFCINITKKAQDGLLDPVIGRHEEIQRLIHILSRRTKNNPLLIGDPGVGKTAIIEGIAQRIINNDVPQSLKSSIIYSLDLGLLIGGAKFQGEFEERLKGLLKEIEKSETHTILFIDEIHMIVGAGGAGSAMDASNLLKPALARGDINCIGATTTNEWKKYIEKDPALERRFQKVLIEEPTIEDSISILRGLKERYEIHHRIKIKDQAIISAVKLSAQYITNRFLPDKAIDLIDEAAAMIKMSIDSRPSELDRLDRKIQQLEIEKVALLKESDEESKKRLTSLEFEKKEIEEQFYTLKKQWDNEKKPLEEISKLKTTIEKEELLYQSAVRDGNYEKASKIKYGNIIEFQKKLQLLEEQRKNHKNRLIKEIVDENEIAFIVSKWTGIPLNKLTENESDKLSKLESILSERIIGQSKAIHEVASSIQIHRLGLSESNKPIGSFLFLGPTGVGKTEVARVLADVIFNDEKNIIRIDMSEHMEKHSVSRLIGAPPGYIGYEEGGQLTEALKHKPYSIVLLDEFEKGHPDVWNILLQILEDGHITDGQGKKINCKQAIFIITSNIASKYILESETISQKIEKTILDELKSKVKPELINRIDSIIIFNKLNIDDIKNISKIQLEKMINKLIEQNIFVTYSENVLDWLSKNGTDNEFGARPLKRLIKKEILQKITNIILKKDFIKENGKIKISIGVENNELKIF